MFMQSLCQLRRAPLHCCMPQPLFCSLPRGRRDHRGRRFGRVIAPLAAAPNRHLLGELRSKPAVITRPIIDACGDTELAYRMIAERDNETVKIERTSSFVIVAKARIWASEGWQVAITDADGKSYALAEFDQLLAA
jgi:hypothetical protein